MMMQNATGERSAMMDQRWRERGENRCKKNIILRREQRRENRGEREER